MAESLYIVPTPVVCVKRPVMNLEHLEIGADGDLVSLTVGNSTMKFHYEDALKISQWLRMRAKQAKRSVGDESRHWSALAVLDGIKT